MSPRHQPRFRHQPRLRHQLRIAVILLALIIVSPSIADSQTVQNPSGLAFFPSPDHSNPAVTGYEADILDVKGQSIQLINLGKPNPNAQGEIVVNLNVQPIAFGSYTIVVRTVAGAVKGPPSSPTEVWQRSPGPPSKVRVQ